MAVDSTAAYVKTGYTVTYDKIRRHFAHIRPIDCGLSAGVCFASADSSALPDNDRRPIGARWVIP